MKLFPLLISTLLLFTFQICSAQVSIDEEEQLILIQPKFEKDTELVYQFTNISVTPHQDSDLSTSTVIDTFQNKIKLKINKTNEDSYEMGITPYDFTFSTVNSFLLDGLTMTISYNFNNPNLEFIENDGLKEKLSKRLAKARKKFRKDPSSLSILDETETIIANEEYLKLLSNYRQLFFYFACYDNVYPYNRYAIDSIATENAFNQATMNVTKSGFFENANDFHCNFQEDLLPSTEENELLKEANENLKQQLIEQIQEQEQQDSTATVSYEFEGMPSMAHTRGKQIDIILNKETLLIKLLATKESETLPGVEFSNSVFFQLIE